MSGLSRSTFVDLISAITLRTHFNKVSLSNPPVTPDATSWKSIEIGQIGEYLPRSPGHQYGSDIWGVIAQSVHKRLSDTEVGRASSKRVFVSYKTASEIAQIMGISSMRDWSRVHATAFSPFDLPIPYSPSTSYKSQWLGWESFLGKPRSQGFLSFKEARELIHSQGIKTANEFREYASGPFAHPQMPKRPDAVYQGEWGGWIDFLAPKFLPYAEAREVMAKMRLRSEHDFRLLGQTGCRPIGIPSHPSVYYGEEFVSWAHFLGWKDEDDRRKAFL